MAPRFNLSTAQRALFTVCQPRTPSGCICNGGRDIPLRTSTNVNEVRRNNAHLGIGIMQQRRMNSSSSSGYGNGKQQEEEPPHHLTSEEGAAIEDRIQKAEGKPSTVEEEQGSPISEVSRVP